VALITTSVFSGKAAEQLAVQSMPAGVETTRPLPSMVTDSRCVPGCGGSGAGGGVGVGWMNVAVREIAPLTVTSHAGAVQRALQPWNCQPAPALAARCRAPACTCQTQCPLQAAAGPPMVPVPLTSMVTAKLAGALPVSALATAGTALPPPHAAAAASATHPSLKRPAGLFCLYQMWTYATRALRPPRGLIHGPSSLDAACRPRPRRMRRKLDFQPELPDLRDRLQ